MKKLLLSLCLSLSLLSPSSAEQVTTNNLLDQNFDNGFWSGSADGRHGSSTIAAEHNTYIRSNSISLRNDAGLNQDQINDGFTTNHTFKYWHWNNYTSRVQSTVTVTGSDGETITQIRNYDSTGCGYINCGSYVNGGDTIDISRNIQADYGLSVRYDFTDSSQSTTSHYGVDLKEPSLTVTYESDPIRIDNTTITSLNTSFAKVEDDLNFEEQFIFEEIKFENTTMKEEEKFEEFKFEESFIEETPLFEQYETPQMQEEIKAKESLEEMTFTETPAAEKEEESPLLEFFASAEEQTSEKKEEPSSLPVEPQSSEEKSEQLSQDNPQEEQKSTAENDSNDNVSDEQKKQVSLEKNIKLIDVKIKDPGKNMELKNLVKLNAMTDNVMLSNYQISFYKEKPIYLDQINIQDNRVIYTKTLATYQQNDPIFIQEKILFDIRQEKQKLIKEIQVLKNAG